MTLFNPLFLTVIPAKAGIQLPSYRLETSWTPAFAGVTGEFGE